jgi:hypothetical protein
MRRYAARSGNTSSHACSQRRQTSAQTRQCSWWSACRSHSFRQTRHAWAQACTTGRASSGSNSVCLLRIWPVVVHTSPQSRQRRIHRINMPTSFSARSASAQAVQLCAQSKHASMHASSAPASIAPPRGCVSNICSAWVTSISIPLFGPTLSLRPSRVKPSGPVNYRGTNSVAAERNPSPGRHRRREQECSRRWTRKRRGIHAAL